MELKDDQLFQKAKAASFRLLKLRPRSIKELRDRLSQKKYPAVVIGKVVDELKAMEMLDDEAFAKLGSLALILPVGLRQLVRELEMKGISKELITGHLESVKEDYDEVLVVRKLAEKRNRAYAGLPALKRKKRLFDYLLRRGFSPEAVNKVVREL